MPGNTTVERSGISDNSPGRSAPRDPFLESFHLLFMGTPPQRRPLASGLGPPEDPLGRQVEPQSTVQRGLPAMAIWSDNYLKNQGITNW